MSLMRVIEALLFSAQKPLSIREIATAIKSAEDPAAAEPNEFARLREAEVAAALEQLKIEYVEQQRAVQLIEKAEGWQFATDSQYARRVRQLCPASKPASRGHRPRLQRRRDRQSPSSACRFLGSTGCQPVLFGSLPKSPSNVRWSRLLQCAESRRQAADDNRLAACAPQRKDARARYP